MSDIPLPIRSNLVAECVKVMRLRIAAGEWKEHLPGERRLAGQLQVGRDTVRLMLQELETAGVIAPASTGSRRRILATNPLPARPENQTIRVGMLSPYRLERLPQPMLLEVDHIRTALAAKNGTFELHAPGWYENAHPENRLAQLLHEEPCSVWLLYRSTAEVQRWFERSRVPCLVRGYPQPGVHLPHLDVDWHATAHHAAGTLWRLGHRRVAILAAGESLGGVAAAVRGVMDFQDEGFRPMELTEDGTVEGTIRALTRALVGNDPPTALITTRPRQAATAMTWLGSRGIRVPDHISIVTLSREPFLEFLVPQIAGYKIDPAAVAKLVTRRLERLLGGSPFSGVNPWIVPDFIKGSSMGPPAPLTKKKS